MRQINAEIFFTIWVRFRPADTTNILAIRIALELAKQLSASLGSMQPVTISAATLIREMTAMDTRLLRNA